MDKLLATWQAHNAVYKAKSGKMQVKLNSLTTRVEFS